MKKNIKAWAKAQTEGEIENLSDTNVVKEWNPEMTSSNIINFIADCFNINSPE